LPSAVNYSNGTRTGYQLADLSVGSSETLNFGNNTKIIDITVLDLISPTSVGITANNRTYTLTTGSPVALADPDNYTYYAELVMGVSSLNTVTLLVYGQANQQTPPPAAIAATSSTAVPTTTVPVPPASIAPTTTVAPPPAAAVPPSSSSNYLVAWVAVALIVALGALVCYYHRTKGGSASKGRKE
jgi:hypothetical protein